jgi:2-dehydro-3-deoxyphosphogluconate aldolase/(4S)-4-hydroxy-2-oxoglutarate aldolase
VTVAHQDGQAVAAIAADRILAVVVLDDAGTATPLAEALLAGGLRTVEVTLRTPAALDAIRVLAARSDLVVGAGTALTAEQVDRCVDAGAQFVVSPVFRRSLIEACHERGVPVTPGCFTPTEILDAWEAGADLVKVVPATALGPGYIRDVRAPLPHVKLMPTGGVTVDNAGEWIKAGAVAVGVGSALLDTNAIEAGDYGVLRAKAERIVANVNAARR